VKTCPLVANKKEVRFMNLVTGRALLLNKVLIVSRQGVVL